MEVNELFNLFVKWWNDTKENEGIMQITIKYNNSLRSYKTHIMISFRKCKASNQWPIIIQSSNLIMAVAL